MPDKQDNKTKITPGVSDSGKKHGKNQRDEAESMDQQNGDQAAPQPKKKTEEKKSASGVKGLFTFINDVKTEAKKITWPPRSQVMQETWSVIVMVTFITFMVLGFDYALGNWIFGPIEHAAKMMAPATPDTPFSEAPAPYTPETSRPAPGPLTPGTTPPDSKLPVPAPVIPGTTNPDASGATPAPGTPTPAAPGSTLPLPEGTRPGLPAPTSPAPSPVPGATTPPATTTAPATTTPAVPTPAPTGATPPSTTAPPAPATPTTPHP